MWYNVMVSMNTGYGGARAGAGRPRVVASVLRDRKVVERRLKLAAEEGWEVLADKYPSLIRKAVEVAMGSEEQAPNVAMLRTLVELMVKVVGSEPDQSDSKMKQLLERFFDRLPQEPIPDQSVVDGNGQGRDAGTNGGYGVWAAPDSVLPGMGGRL